MDLLIDLGNSRLKWAVLDQDRLGPVACLEHGGIAPALERHWASLTRPGRVKMANVAGPAVGASVVRAVHDLWGIRADLLIAPARGNGIVSGYRNPVALGVDRWLAMVAARHRYPGPLLVVDAGTAVTIDLLDARGQHQGGAIVPGLTGMGDALLAHTRITRPGPAPPPAPGQLLGNDTAGCMAAGATHAIAGMIERIFRLAREQLAGAPDLVLTGGGADYLAPRLSVPVNLEPALVLWGLALMES
jgi:type III pantothenate kinase